MTLRHNLLLVMGLVALSLFLASCDELRGPGGGDANQWVDVNVTVHKPSSATLINGLAVTGTGQIGTSLIVLVPADTTATPYFEQLAASDVLDQALLDLATSSVSLSIPLGVSVQLFEYTFNDIMNLAQILADTPVAGTPNISSAFTVEAGLSQMALVLNLQTTNFSESFNVALSDINWERVDSGATVSGGVLNMSVSATHDSTLSPAEQRFGASTVIQSNRNLQLNNQRIAGTMRVGSFSTSDTLGAPDAAQARLIAGLYYQPRSDRATTRTGLTGVRIMFLGRTVGTPIFVFNAFTCLNDTCASVGAGDLEILATLPYAFSFAAAPNTDVPFEIEYQGGGVFKGTFSGEVLTFNLPALGATVFDASDFLYVRMQTQGMFMQDAADAAAITAVFDDIVMGDGPVSGIAVTPTGGLLVNEVGTDTFNVVLTAAPSADVAIGLSSSNAADTTISPLSLTFTNTNWNTPQTVTVAGIDNFVADGNRPATIITAPAVSADPDYNLLDAADVALTVVDDDIVGITLSIATVTTSETPASSVFAVALNSQPTANVTIGLSSSDTTEATVTPTSLTFTPVNWATPQAVTVVGVDDIVNDGSVIYTIVTAPAASTDPLYNGLNAADVTGTNLDNDSVVVDAALGNDLNAGTDAAPVKTITQGLTLTGGLITGVLVRPGLYDAANGELFPLTVPAGISLIGDDANKGRGATFTTISGVPVVPAGFTIQTLIHANASTQIRGFNLVNSGAGITLSLAVNGMALFNNSIINAPGHAIKADGGAHGIVGNVITGATGNAIWATSTLMSRVAGNIFTGNSRAIEPQGNPASVDLGGGTLSSAGGNIFSCNTGTDFFMGPAIAISAQNNFWDHVPPTVDNVIFVGGIDIHNAGGGANIDTTGAALAPAPCP